MVNVKLGFDLYVGFNKDVDKEKVGRIVQDSTITKILNLFSTKQG